VTAQLTSPDLIGAGRCDGPRARSVPIAIATAAAATAATATAAATTATAAATTVSATAALVRFVDTDGAPIEGRSVHRFLRLYGCVAVFHGDEPEAARPTGVTVGDHLGLDDPTELLEGLTKGIIRRIPTQPTHE
jgi:hypothetical protein